MDENLARGLADAIGMVLYISGVGTFLFLVKLYITKVKKIPIQWSEGWHTAVDSSAVIFALLLAILMFGQIPN